MSAFISPLTSKLHVSVDPQNMRGRLIVMPGVLPDDLQEKIVEVVGRNILRYGLPRGNNSGSNVSFVSDPKFSKGIFGIQRTEQDSIPQVEISYAPYVYYGMRANNSSGRKVYSHPEAPIKVLFKGLRGAGGQLEKLIDIKDGENKKKSLTEVEALGFDNGDVDQNAVSQHVVETSVRTRGARAVGYEESVDSMLQEFSDTSINYTETSHHALQRRYEIEFADLKDPNKVKANVDLLAQLIFAEDGEILYRNILAYHYNSQNPSEGSFIELRDDVKPDVINRIERQPGGQKTKLVRYIPSGNLPMDIVGIPGLRDFYTKRVLGEVIPKLERKKEEEKVNWGIAKLAYILDQMSGETRETYIPTDELSKLILG